MTKSYPRILIIGLDGADFNLVKEGQKKDLFELFSKLNLKRLRTTLPPLTFPAWSSFLTGVRPDWHGLFDFSKRVGYRVIFTGGWDRKREFIFNVVARKGRKVILAGFPSLSPIHKIENLIQIGGWDTPFNYKTKGSFVYPIEIYDCAKKASLGDFFHLYDRDSDEFNFELKNYNRFILSLLKRIRKRGRFYRWLLRNYRWDISAIYFGEIDTVSHFLWQLHDRDSPWNIESTPKSPSSPIFLIYKAIEDEILKILGLTSPDIVIILSDHGFIGSSTKLVHLNKFLERHGLLSFKGGRVKVSHSIRSLVRFIPYRLRGALFKFHNNLLPSILETYIRFGNIDWERTYLFSEEINYFPSIWINLKDREPKGIVKLKEKDRLIEEVKILLKEELKDPETKKPIVKEVYLREELWDGPYASLAPDMILELNNDKNRYRYNIFHSRKDSEVVSFLPKEAIIRYRKGKLLPGTHNETALLLFNIDIFEKKELAIWDIADSILKLFDIKKEELENSLPIHPYHRKISERLWALGYIG